MAKSCCAQLFARVFVRAGRATAGRGYQPASKAAPQGPGSSPAPPDSAPCQALPEVVDEALRTARSGARSGAPKLVSHAFCILASARDFVASVRLLKQQCCIDTVLDHKGGSLLLRKGRSLVILRFALG